MFVICCLIVMSYFVERLPEELVCVVKDFVLSVDIKLSLLYQKYEIDEKFIKKMLKGFNSKQLEAINWKYLYYKIFKVSPPRCDNRNLATIFECIEEEYPSYYDYVRTNGDISYSEPKYKLCNKSVRGFGLLLLLLEVTITLKMYTLKWVGNVSKIIILLGVGIILKTVDGVLRWMNSIGICAMSNMSCYGH